MKTWMLAVLMTIAFWGVSSQAAQAEDDSNVIIARGEYRAEIKSHDILNRPYRPGHFYGNTVRRRHHQGAMLPAPRNARR